MWRREQFGRRIIYEYAIHTHTHAFTHNPFNAYNGVPHISFSKMETHNIVKVERHSRQPYAMAATFYVNIRASNGRHCGAIYNIFQKSVGAKTFHFWWEISVFELCALHDGIISRFFVTICLICCWNYEYVGFSDAQKKGDEREIVQWITQIDREMVSSRLPRVKYEYCIVKYLESQYLL